MDKHELSRDRLEQFWCYCPEQSDSVCLEQRPKFCPMCGESLKGIQLKEKGENHGKSL